MKSVNPNLIKQVTKALKQLEANPSSNTRHYYTLAYKRKVIMHALAYNAEHTSVTLGIPSKTVRLWLRAVGLEGAINSYHWKRK